MNLFNQWDPNEFKTSSEASMVPQSSLKFDSADTPKKECMHDNVSP